MRVLQLQVLGKCRHPAARSLGIWTLCNAPATVGRKKGAASGFLGGCTGLLRALSASRCTRLCHCTATKKQTRAQTQQTWEFRLTGARSATYSTSSVESAAALADAKALWV